MRYGNLPDREGALQLREGAATIPEVTSKNLPESGFTAWNVKNTPVSYKKIVVLAYSGFFTHVKSTFSLHRVRTFDSELQQTDPSEKTQADLRLFHVASFSVS